MLPYLRYTAIKVVFIGLGRGRAALYQHFIQCNVAINHLYAQGGTAVGQLYVVDGSHGPYIARCGQQHVVFHHNTARQQAHMCWCARLIAQAHVILQLHAHINVILQPVALFQVHHLARTIAQGKVFALGASAQLLTQSCGYDAWHRKVYI